MYLVERVNFWLGIGSSNGILRSGHGPRHVDVRSRDVSSVTLAIGC